MKTLFDKPGTRSEPHIDCVPSIEFRIHIKPSVHYTVLLLALHAFSLLALWETPHLPLAVLLPLVLLVLISTAVTLYRSAEHTTLAWLTDEQLLLSVDRHSAHRLGNPARCHTTLSPRSLHCSLFVLLEMRDSQGHRRHCLIPRNSVSDTGYRMLRSRLYLRERVTD